MEALYTRSKMEVNGDYLFVPIVSKEGGKTSFKWNAQDGTDYYGYDLGESSGHLHAGITWTQPLLGRSSYRVAEEQTRIQADILANDIKLEEHLLERTVTEQYILCLLDKTQIDFADSIGNILAKQELIVQKLVRDGIAMQSDLNLLAIEREANHDLKIVSNQSFRTHLSDLNILCGIADTTIVRLEALCLYPNLTEHTLSSFMKQYRLDSLNVAADLRSFKSQYKPQLNLFVDGGLRLNEYAHPYRHFGWSAGLTFSWTIFDGKQKRQKEWQAQIQQKTIAHYRKDFQIQMNQRKKRYLSEMRTYDERQKALVRQLAEYDAVLSDYMKEIRAGQRSVIDYITVLRSKIQAKRDYMALKANQQLLVTAYNYWNW